MLFIEKRQTSLDKIKVFLRTSRKPASSLLLLCPKLTFVLRNETIANL
jgi:rRNA maturation protein Rpf1